MQWLADIPSPVWVSLLTPILVAAAVRAGNDFVRPDSDGWVHLRRPAVVVALGFVALPIATGIAVVMGMAVGFLFKGNADAGLLLIVAAPLAALFWYVVYAFLIIGLRFSANGVEFRGLLRTRFVPWSCVRGLKYSGFLGPYAVTESGNFLVSMYFRGFKQFLDEAKGRNVDIDEGIERARTHGY
jgi:hypothetical protein